MAWYNRTSVFVSTKCLILHRTPIPLYIYIFKFVGFVQLLPETGRLQVTNQTNLETEEQTEWIEMHQSLVNMFFLRGPLR